MTTSGTRFLASAVMTAVMALGLGGCIFDNPCDDCGSSCSSGGRLGRAVDEASIAIPANLLTVVWSEPDGTVVVEVTITGGGYCGSVASQSLYYVWDPFSQSPQQRALGPVEGSRRLAPTTEGGGTRTYEDAAPGLIIRVSNMRSQNVAIGFTGPGPGGGATTRSLNCEGYYVGGLTCQ